MEILILKVCIFKKQLHLNVLRLKNPVKQALVSSIRFKSFNLCTGTEYLFIFIFIYLYRNSKQHKCSALSCFECVGCDSRAQRERALMACSVQRLEQQSRSCHGQSADNSRKPEILPGQQQRWLNIQVPRGARNFRYANHNCNNTNPHRCKN